MNKRTGQTGRLIVGSSLTCKSSIFTNANCSNQPACRERPPQWNVETRLWRLAQKRLKTDNIQQHVELWPFIHQPAEIYGANQSRCRLLEIEREWRQRESEDAWIWWRGVNGHFFFHLSEAPRPCLDSAVGWCTIRRSALVSPRPQRKSAAVNKRISGESARSRPLGAEATLICGGVNLTCWNAALTAPPVVDVTICPLPSHHAGSPHTLRLGVFRVRAAFGCCSHCGWWMDGGELTKTVTLWLPVNSLDSGGNSKETLEKPRI